jgi:phenylpropionate dioxygenase-like ring-hydroxylating dioxygenase large terminal subunit
MLSYEHNEMLCRVGRGTPMGNLMRQYWVPALPSTEFPTPDCPPKRMMLLGENLVMFRDSLGRVGALAEACPHRGASLYFGRNEECGLRCAYHGWKFDIHGNCLDLPSEEGIRKENFEANLKARAYPCREVNHMVWVYLGPRKVPPPLPLFEALTLPPDHVTPPNIMMEEANWLQNMEGDLDSAHLDWVHRRLAEDSPKPDKGIRGFWSPEAPRPPKLDVVPTDYGVYYSARRRLDNTDEWHRINQFIFPFHTMITSGDGKVGLRSFVPLDDTHAMLITQSADPVAPLPPGTGEAFANRFEEVGGYIERTHDPRSYFMTKYNKRNDYGRDLDVQKSTMFCGIPFVVNLQDRAMTELMCNDKGEPIYDRTQEHLTSSDAMIIAVRKQLLDAVTNLRDNGKVPPNVDNVELDKVRAATLRLPIDGDWKAASEAARRVANGKPSAGDLPTIL